MRGVGLINLFAGERIPTLIETIHCLSELNLNANVEIKPYPGHEEKTAFTVMELINKQWPSHLSPPLVTSFSLDTLRMVRAENRDTLLGLLFEEIDPNWKELAEELNCFSVHVDKQYLTQEVATAVKVRDYALLSYTVNNQDEAQRLFALGVDCIFSDVPDKIK